MQDWTKRSNMVLLLVAKLRRGCVHGADLRGSSSPAGERGANRAGRNLAAAVQCAGAQAAGAVLVAL